MQQTCSDSANHIKKQIGDVTKKVFDVFGEDPKKQPVPREVQEAGIEKHARNQGHEGNLKAGVSRQEGRKAGWDRGVWKKQSVERSPGKCGFQADLVDKYDDVGEDQRDIDEGIGARWVEVLEWDEHG